MASLEEIQELMKAWVNVPTLTSEQNQLVVALRDASMSLPLEGFLVFATSLFHQYDHDITQAIIKARAEGLGAKKH